jgi:hypothetical protein
MDEYDAGLLGDFGGGNVEWWQDYIRSELGNAYDFYQSQTSSQNTTEKDRVMNELRSLVCTILGLHPEYKGRISSGVSKNTPCSEYERCIGKNFIDFLNAQHAKLGGE